MTDPAPRVLYVSTRPAWPLGAGYAIRAHGLAVGCAASGDCDLVYVAPSDESRELPPELAGRVSMSVVPVTRRSAPATLWHWAVRGLPWAWARIDWTQAASRVGELVEHGGHDGVLVSGIDAWGTVPPALRERVVLDFDDVESKKIGHRMANRAQAYRGALGRWMWLRDRVDLGRWQRIEAAVVREARGAVVCSDADREWFGSAKVHTVPNTYPSTGAPVQRRHHENEAPVVLFVGSLTTPPNREAVRFLVEQVMPEVWTRLPEARLRLVGRAAPDVQERHDPPRVDVVGFVDDLDDELARADVVVAPFLSGGGTRIKILEAFFHGIPVVSTHVGAEGIDAIDGEHLLLRDDPAAFAEACVAVVRDSDLSERLVGAARTLVRDHYSPDAVNEAVRRCLVPVRH